MGIGVCEHLLFLDSHVVYLIGHSRSSLGTKTNEAGQLYISNQKTVGILIIRFMCKSYLPVEGSRMLWPPIHI
jgi:hypothetical protein